MSTGKFSVKGWHSNSLADEFPADVEADVLGHVWNKSSDTFAPKVILLNTKARLTKRLILSAISKLWDPIGVFSPVTLKLRLLLQLFWQLKLSWDDEVDNSIKAQYFRLAEEVHDLSQVHLPRSLTPALSQGPLEIHGFSDGGEQAYGACYGEIHYNFYLGIALSLFDIYYVCAFSIRHAETLKLRLRHNVSLYQIESFAKRGQLSLAILGLGNVFLCLNMLLLS